MLPFLKSVDDHDFQGSSPSVARGMVRDSPRDLPSRNVVVVVVEEEEGMGVEGRNKINIEVRVFAVFISLSSPSLME